MSNKYVGSIVGEELSSYVQDQITTRQIAHGSGWNGQRTSEQITYLNSRTSWIKLASGTFLSPDKLASMGFGPTAQEKFQGTGLAKNHILFGGYASLSETNPATPLDLVSGTGTFSVDQRTNFLGNNGAYIEGQDFGIVPMPGIESLDVKALNRGSLKKAVLKIKVQDRNQLNILDVLYLRLGYTVLLEWGNSIYLDNKGKLQQVADTILENDQLFFNPTWNQDKAYDDILQYIENYREIYAGNYDGMLGKVSNFNWTFNKDGSYDVELTILSYGDIIESLKTNITAKNATYNAVDKNYATQLKGRAVEDHRTDNILFTILKFFQVLSTFKENEDEKVTVDGVERGFFVKQGKKEIVLTSKTVTFYAYYTLNRLNSDGSSVKVENSEFEYFDVDFYIQTNDETKELTYDPIQAAYKELADKDSQFWLYLQSNAGRSEYDPDKRAQNQAIDAEQQRINQDLDALRVQTNLPNINLENDFAATTSSPTMGGNQLEYQYSYPDPLSNGKGIMNIPLVALGEGTPKNTFPSPAFYMGPTPSNLIKTAGSYASSQFGKTYISKYPIFSWPNREYKLTHIFSSTQNRYTISEYVTFTKSSITTVPLGTAKPLEDGVFKLLNSNRTTTRNSSGNNRYTTIKSQRIITGEIANTPRPFVSYQYPSVTWGILSRDGKTVYDGLETKWGQDINGTKFDFTNNINKKILNRAEPQPGFTNVPGINVPEGWPNGSFTPDSNTKQLDELYKEFQEKKTPEFPQPKYNADGTPADNGYEFFHRFVANNQEDARSSGKEFFWTVNFDRKVSSFNPETIENPIASINPYDEKGFFVLDLDPKQYYIRFGFLLQIIEDKAILKIDKNKPADTYDQNPPIVKIAYNTGSFDMLCLPNQISFDLTKAIVRRDNVQKTWDPALKPAVMFPELRTWANIENPEILATSPLNQETYTLHKNVADIMNIYLNTDFVGQCMLSATDERGNMATYSFINNICIGLNKALTGVNNLEPVIDETTNTLYIIDTTPKYDASKQKKGAYELQLYGYQSYGSDENQDGIVSLNEIDTYESTFSRKVDLKTAITPEYASMIAIGATAAGYAKGIEATAFAKWNQGIEDRFKKNFIPGDKTFATGSTDYKQDIIAAYQQIMQDTLYSLGILSTTP